VLALGYSVGRVEEMARPQGPAAAGRKLLERRLVRIYTPGTAVDGLLAVRGSRAAGSQAAAAPL
jgi:DNA mismatch repair ATPase MutS